MLSGLLLNEDFISQLKIAGENHERAKYYDGEINEHVMVFMFSAYYQECLSDLT